mgnify:CR=1 FL=1
MKIGIDIDNVISNFNEELLKAYKDISYIIEEMKILELDEKYSKEKWELN